ncbi:hypothetical protein G7Y89_g4880 [Cudoniella acicularis]|uniref:Peptide N-acetyl-beta-D-glucosaminyl asparaginase amidase A N-terminal domain-containing protein n=1 Tax=Cudoniella acicularis TaxID=354080 RepID=A0A8H4W4B1_9HELO|nr:hypothetical protein G7Y89_g4880 [Cudoniella acicularis]
MDDYGKQDSTAESGTLGSPNATDTISSIPSKDPAAEPGSDSKFRKIAGENNDKKIGKEGGVQDDYLYLCEKASLSGANSWTSKDSGNRIMPATNGTPITTISDPNNPGDIDLGKRAKSLTASWCSGESLTVFVEGQDLEIHAFQLIETRTSSTWSTLTGNFGGIPGISSVVSIDSVCWFDGLGVPPVFVNSYNGTETTGQLETYFNNKLSISRTLSTSTLASHPMHSGSKHYMSRMNLAWMRFTPWSSHIGAEAVVVAAHPRKQRFAILRYLGRYSTDSDRSDRLLPGDMGFENALFRGKTSPSNEDVSNIILPEVATAGILIESQTIHNPARRRRSEKFTFLLIGCCLAISALSIAPRIISQRHLPKKHVSIASRIHKIRSPNSQAEATLTTTSVAPSSTAVLNVLQVAVPILGPSGALNDVFTSNGSIAADANATTDISSGARCEVKLMEFIFNNSFGKPFVGNYTPPNCMGTANTVVMNFTVQSKGTQFDRLALMYFGDSEVFRTSTAEPRRNGIVWTYEKDMSEYMYFWKSSQKIIFDLPNQTNVNLTGTYNTTLTARFFTAPTTSQSQNPPADVILPISLLTGSNSSSASSVFIIPSSTHNASTSLTLPHNSNRAVLSLSTTGQASEEFWWSNVLSSDTLAFNSTSGAFFGSSPFREIQVLIDNQLAAVQWPFPVIFIGGVVPSLWSPVVGIDAFDLKEYEIDISPWLGVLCDGNAHVFSIKVMGLADNGGTTAELADNVGSSWFVTGKVFVWKDTDANSITTGPAPTLSITPPTIQVSQSLVKNATGVNQTLSYFISVQRSLSVTSTITTQKFGANKETKWTQTLSHTDNGTYLGQGLTQLNTITTTGEDTSSGTIPYAYTYTYPLSGNVSASISPIDGNTTVTALLTRSKNTTLSPPNAGIHPSGITAFASNPKSAQAVSNLGTFSINTTQSGSAFLFQSPSKGISTGDGRGWWWGMGRWWWMM